MRQLCLWESDVTTDNGRAVVTPRKLVSDCSVARAQKILQCPSDTIYRLYHAGLLDGYKPGAIAKRKDGKRSNAKLVLCMESVLKHREMQRQLRA